MTSMLLTALALLVQGVGLVLVPLGLPGLWVQVAAATTLALWSGWSWVWSVTFVVLALLGEGIEFVSGRWGARRFGGSPAAAWGALLGGIAGAVLGGIPVPIVGAVLASFVGTFAGALLGEMWTQRHVAPNLRVGFGAVLGRVIGVASKLSLGFVIFVLSLVGVFT